MKSPVADKFVLYDRWLLASVILLICIGLIMVASASIVISEKVYHTPFHFFFHQLIYLMIGFVCSYFVLKVPVTQWQVYSLPLLGIVYLLLILVLIPGIGSKVNGSSRWLGIGPLGFQVSELAKLIVIVYLARYVVNYNTSLKQSIFGFIKPMVLLALLSLLLLLEPDFGTCVVIIVSAFAILFLAGARLYYFTGLILLCGALLALLAISAPYRLLRVTTFLHPWLHQFGSGYQLTQSLIGFGRGGWWGVGLGNSIQKLFYLPEAHTDFLFAVIAEELGLLGIVSILMLYALLISRILLVGLRAHKQTHYFSSFVAYGIAVWLAIQTFINMGVNMGLLPTKGITLPFLSYGGSSMLISCISIALLLRIDYEARLTEFGITDLTLLKDN